jgi:predicted nucleotidyltransferase
MTEYIEYIEENDSDWSTVTAKSHHSKSLQKKIMKPISHVSNVSYEELVQVLISELSYYNNIIVACYLYGSRARGTNRIDSDADLLIFWKVKMEDDELQEIRESIESKLGFSVDFVSCIYKRKVSEQTNECDIAFFENIALDAKQIIGKLHNIIWLSECSEKCKKLIR